MPSAAVIGAGLGGISTAIRLAVSGWDVDVFDRQSFAGGKAGSHTIEGYRFDTGPSLLTMPRLIEDLFHEAGAQMGDYLQLVELDEICRYFYSDLTRLSSFSETARFVDEMVSKLGISRHALERFLGHSSRIYGLSSELFLESSLHEFSTYTTLSFLKGLAGVGFMDLFRSMDSANRSFFDNPKAVQLFNRYATYNGSNPYTAPATLNIIPHLEYGIGAAAVRGGIYAIPTALKKLAEERGVKFLLGTEVTSITTRNDSYRSVRGLIAGDEEYSYDVVVSNGDVLHTYRDLLRDTDAPLYTRYRGLEPSSSGLVFYLGMKDSFPELGLHNIFFSKDYRREFDDIFERGVCPEDPTLYVNITSKIDSSDAPPGSENWFVLINAPRNSGQDWEHEVTRMREKVIRIISNRLDRNRIEESIEVEDAMTPADIERNTGSSYGSLYGISSNSRTAAFLRHPNRSRRYRGLYFCGGSVHPGGGIPLVLLSGKITADIIRRRHE
jgi:phytoene desaturase